MALIEVPKVDGGTVLLHSEYAPVRIDPHPGGKPLVRVTFHDGVELHLAVHWKDLARVFDLAVDRLDPHGKLHRILERAREFEPVLTDVFSELKVTEPAQFDTRIRTGLEEIPDDGYAAPYSEPRAPAGPPVVTLPPEEPPAPAVEPEEEHPHKRKRG